MLQIEDSAGNVGPGEREYLVAPISETTAKSLPRTGGPPSSKRKIFEWMTDEQWQNLQVTFLNVTNVFENKTKIDHSSMFLWLLPVPTPKSLIGK